MKPKHILQPLLMFALAGSASAVVVGTESFDYTDVPIDGLSGGTGFDYDNLNDTHTGVSSSWDTLFGDPQVSGGRLLTGVGGGSGSQRIYNGDDEATGAARLSEGDPIVFYRFDINRSADAVWSGASSYDFGSERIFFGVTGFGAAGNFAGIDISGVENANSSVSLNDDQTYTMVAVLDSLNELVGLFVDPTGSDFWNTANGSNSADLTLPYTGTNWSSAVRLASDGEVRWDDLTVAFDDPNDVGLLSVPEPAISLVAGLSMLTLLRRRR